MSAITNLRIRTHCNDLSGKFWNPAIHWTDKHAVFVEIEDDEGRIGLGECWCFDAAPDALCAFLRTEIIPSFLGQHLSAHQDISADLMRRATLTARHGILASALSGIDIAAHDLLAQAQNRPIWKMLDEEGSGHVPLYASGGLYGKNKGIADLGSELATMAKSGFPIVKMKIGGLGIEDDLARIDHVLEVLPVTTRLVVDAVYSLPSDDALRVFDALPAARIEAFHSPTAADDFKGMARLVRAGVPVMATEAEYRQELHAKLVEDRAVTLLQTAPIACGGFTRLLDMANLVRDTDVRLSLEVSSTAIALMAACQFAAANDTVAHVEYHHLHQVFFDRLPWQNTAFAQTMPLPDQTGLGITLPHHEVELVFETSNPPEEGAVPYYIT